MLFFFHPLDKGSAAEPEKTKLRVDNYKINALCKCRYGTMHAISMARTDCGPSLKGGALSGARTSAAPRNGYLLRELQIVCSGQVKQQLVFIRAVLERAPNLQKIVLRHETCEECTALGCRLVALRNVFLQRARLSRKW